ncbi:glycosyltransferase family 8 protein, partial [Haemophilus influenzae]
MTDRQTDRQTDGRTVSQTMNIIFSSDNYYAPYLAVSIFSIIKN